MIPFQDKLPIVAKATLPTYGSLCNYESSIPVTSSLNVLLSQAIQILVMPRILLPKRNHKVESWSDNQPVLFMGVGMQLLEPTNGKIVLVPPDWKKCAGTPMSYTTLFKHSSTVHQFQCLYEIPRPGVSLVKAWEINLVFNLVLAWKFRKSE